MFKWIVNTLDRICAVIGALVFSQAPMFMQQYTQQLGGHVAELRLQIEAMTQAADQSGKTLELFIQKFTSNSDLDVMRQGEIMQKMLERYHSLSETYLLLSQSSAFTKPFIFVSDLYGDIAKSTLATFNFGLEFSLEGLIYALIGIFFGYSIFAGIKKGFRAIGNLLRPAKKTPQSDK